MSISRIYYFVRRGFPGLRTNHIQVAKTCDAFSALGIDTTVVAPTATGETEDSVRERLGLRRPLKLHTLCTSMFAGVSGLNHWLFDRALERFLHDFDHDGQGVILYGRTSQRYPMANLLDRKWTGGPRILCEVHDGRQSTPWVDRLRRASGVVTVSRALKEHFVRREIDGGRIHVAPDGVELEAYDQVSGQTHAQLRRSLGLPNGHPMIGFTGQLRYDRGGSTLVRSLKHMSNGCRIVFVGGREEETTRLKSLAREEGLESRVVFVGRVSHADVARYQMAMDVLVMPYGSDLETRDWCSPLKMFEYMAAARPIVSSKLPVLQEVLQDGENALLVPPDDPRALAGALGRVLEDPETAGRLGRRAREDAGRYTWETRARGILAFADSLEQSRAIV